MDQTEETPNPEEPIPSEETHQVEAELPEGFIPITDQGYIPRARRRRAQRMLVPPGTDDRGEMLDTLARRAFPSFEFFLFAFLSGIVLGAGFLLDVKMNSQALLLLGVLLAPSLTPWVGMTLAAITGSWRFFFLTLGGLIVAGLLVFLTGALAGLVGRLWLPMPVLFQADVRSHLWWPDLFIVALGAVLLAISFVHSEQKPILSGVLLAYGFFMPLSSAGYELGIGTITPWSNGLLIFIINLSLATLIGGIVLVALRFKPAKPGGYILPAAVGLLSVITLFTYTGLLTFIRDGITAVRRVEPTPTLPGMPSASPTSFHTYTPVVTQNPSSTPFPSLTPAPPPAYALIKASSYGGANLRTEPGGGVLLYTISNDLIVQVLPEIRNVGTVNWVHVRWNNFDGWVLQSVLTATDLTPTLVPTPRFTATP